MADIRNIVESRFKSLEDSASKLQTLLEVQRQKEEQPEKEQLLYALGGGTDPRLLRIQERALDEHMLEGQERALGKYHPDTLQTVSDLAQLYHRVQRRTDEAEVLYKRALWGRERALGKDHPDTIESVNDLAWFYEDQDRDAEAEPLYKRALEARERTLGKDHPDTVRTLKKLLWLYRWKRLPADGGHQQLLNREREVEEREARERDAREREAREHALSAKYQPLETAITTHIQGLASFKSDIEGLIQKQNKGAFWNGFWMNALFFVLGLAASAIPISASEVWTLIGVHS